MTRAQLREIVDEMCAFEGIEPPGEDLLSDDEIRLNTDIGLCMLIEERLDEHKAELAAKRTGH
jgi:hypothetical protein